MGIKVRSPRYKLILLLPVSLVLLVAWVFLVNLEDRNEIHSEDAALQPNADSPIAVTSRQLLTEAEVKGTLELRDGCVVIVDPLTNRAVVPIISTYSSDVSWEDGALVSGDFITHPGEMLSGGGAWGSTPISEFAPSDTVYIPDACDPRLSFAFFYFSNPSPADLLGE